MIFNRLEFKEKNISTFSCSCDFDQIGKFLCCYSTEFKSMLSSKISTNIKFSFNQVQSLINFNSLCLRIPSQAEENEGH